MLIETSNKLIASDEVFKVIPETDSKYTISNYGRVLSVKKDKLIALSKNKHGYIKTCIRKGKNNRSHVLVHRLVAEAFCDENYSCNIVNHIDNDRSHNYYKNLEFTTTKGNVAHAIAQGRMYHQTEYSSKCNDLLKGNQTQIDNAIKWKTELLGKSLVGSTVVDIQFRDDFSSKVEYVRISCNSCNTISDITNATFKTHWHRRKGKLPYCRKCVLKGLAPKV